jgi:hypothetical protein
MAKVEILQYKEDVYDITVSDNHNFYANDILIHNCVEIGKYPVLIEGDKKTSGFQGCNLSEINGSKCTTKEEFFKACRVGAILGTLQAGYTDFKFLGEASKKIFDREALIGVSITGWMNSPDILFDEEILREGAAIVRRVNRKLAALIGINPAARTTCVKPSGNACQDFHSVIKTSAGDMTLLEVFEFVTDNEFNIDDSFEGQEIRPTKELFVYDEFNMPRPVSGLYVNGYDDAYEVVFEDGSTHVFTGNHKLKTPNGWVLVSDLSADDEILQF